MRFMRSRTVVIGNLGIALAVAACSTPAPYPAGTSTPTPSVSSVIAAESPSLQPTGTNSSPSTPAPPAQRTLLFDTDVAADDLVALSFLVATPNVRLVGITVSGTGEAHCAGGVDVVLRLLDRLDAPDIPVTCGRETPLRGTHAFPDAWRERVDVGSGLDLPSTSRLAVDSTAVELIGALAKEHADLDVLITGPSTNVADAFLADPDLAARLGAVTVMGGALHVPGNLVCCGAPEGNAVAEWNVYADPMAARVVIDSGVDPSFVSLDGTSQVPLTPAFAERAMELSPRPAGGVLAGLLTANPFMTEGAYFLWDPLAAMVAAGYPIGSFSPASIAVEEAEGPEVGFTRPTSGTPNAQYLTTVDASTAEDTLLGVLSR